MSKIIIIDTGGTFNKIYDEILGELTVPNNSLAVNKIFNNSLKTNKKPVINGLIYKDSLAISKADRKLLLNEIKRCKSKKIIIIHGTDTMDKTAKILDKNFKNKTIVFVGAMKPFSIEPIEATANLMSAFGFLQNSCKNGIYISMNGFIKNYKQIIKNKTIGVFECL